MTRRPSALQHELQQKRPFSSPRQEGVVGLLRTADLVRRSLSRVMESRGLTLQQYNVLRILRGAGDQGCPTLEIAQRMIEQSPGITRLVDRLDSKGLVRRERCAKDRRQVLCWITAAGLSLLAQLDAPVTQTDEALLGGLGGRDLERLIEVLDAVRAKHAAASTKDTTSKQRRHE
jgi:DNA-binding MarR family transcriptional regulator